MDDHRQGLSAGISAYIAWGFMPVYLRLLRGVPALEVVAHRALWSCVFLCALVSLKREWGPVRQALTEPRTLLRFLFSAGLLSINWCLYVLAVDSARVVDASLGYFINPLLNVALGVLVLKERMRTFQWAAIAVATAGVLWLCVVTRQVPWIGLVIAVSFSVYGYCRKTARLGALHGLLLETLLVVPIALAWIGLQAARAPVSPDLRSGTLSALLALSGVVTALPLLLFSYAARRVPLSLLGIIQYVSPSIQFCLGIFLWAEPFGLVKSVGYGLIWLAVAIYAVEGYRVYSRAATGAV